MNVARLCSLGLVLVIAGCGGDGGSGPSQTPNLSGSWRGSARDSDFGTGTMTATLTQSGASLTGNWSVQFPDGLSTGTVTNGSVTGSNFVARLEPSDPTDCPLQANGSLSGNRLTGTYVTVQCTVNANGSFDLTR